MDVPVGHLGSDADRALDTTGRGGTTIGDAGGHLFTCSVYRWRGAGDPRRWTADHPSADDARGAGDDHPDDGTAPIRGGINANTDANGRITTTSTSTSTSTSTGTGTGRGDSTNHKRWLMIQLGFAAMGTTVLLRGHSEALLDRACDVFEKVEGLCSRFRPDSELSRLNVSEEQAVTVSPMLAEALEAADRARTLSDGLVDAAVGNHVAAWGYDRTFDDVADLRIPPALLRPVGRWSISDGVVTRPPGTLLDLGGTAKGWTCDLVVERNLAVVVNAGGDIRSNDPGLAVDIEDPDGTTYAGVHLGIGALATSSTRRRAWRVAGNAAHHLVDPRTGSPAESPIISASAIAATAVLAETAAKTMLLLGADGLAWAARQAWIRGAIVWWCDGAVYATAGVTAA